MFENFTTDLKALVALVITSLMGFYMTMTTRLHKKVDKLEASQAEDKVHHAKVNSTVEALNINVDCLRNEVSGLKKTIEHDNKQVKDLLFNILEDKIKKNK